MCCIWFIFQSTVVLSFLKIFSSLSWSIIFFKHGKHNSFIICLILLSFVFASCSRYFVWLVIFYSLLCNDWKIVYGNSLWPRMRVPFSGKNLELSGLWNHFKVLRLQSFFPHIHATFLLLPYSEGSKALWKSQLNRGKRISYLYLEKNPWSFISPYPLRAIQIYLDKQFCLLFDLALAQILPWSFGI